MADIYIAVDWNGWIGTAETVLGKQTLYEEGRTQAEALSKLCAKIAKKREYVGKTWTAPAGGVSGVVGETTKRKRRSSISDMASFQLLGGKMNDA